MAGRRTAASGGSREESSVRKGRNPGTRAPVRDDELHGGPGRGPARGAAVTLRLRHGGADVRDVRRSLPGAQDRAVLPGSGGGLPGAWGRRYTLYPPGHYPYGRVSYAPYSTAGQVLVDAESGQPQWEATLFEAALDARAGGALAIGAAVVAALGGARAANPGASSGVGRTADRGASAACRGGARTDRHAAGGGDDGPEIAGARAWGRWWRTRGVGGAACPCRRRLDAGPLGGSWGGQRPVGVAAPATGGALGGGRRRLGAGAGPWFRRPV